MQEALLILATVLQRVQFERVPGVEVKEEALVTLRPVNGLPVKVHAAQRVGAKELERASLEVSKAAAAAGCPYHALKQPDMPHA